MACNDDRSGDRDSFAAHLNHKPLCRTQDERTSEPPDPGTESVNHAWTTFAGGLGAMMYLGEVPPAPWLDQVQ
jgi:hypothetical protein